LISTSIPLFYLWIILKIKRHPLIFHSKRAAGNLLLGNTYLPVRGIAIYTMNFFHAKSSWFFIAKKKKRL
jgi:hypothetical protein